MHYQQDLGQCEEIAKRALEHMAEHKLAATPQNYALWFTHLTGENKALSLAIEARLSAGQRITQEDCTRLFDEFLSNNATEDAMIELGDSVSVELDTIQALLKTAHRDTSNYGDTLEGVSGQLAKPIDPALAKVVIDNLVNATRSMASRSKRLEERLDQSRAEVTRLKDGIAAVRIEARTDQLTALFNRKAFDETIVRSVEVSMAGNQPLSLIFGDIDKFKNFNDTWGHQTGDQVLRLVAHCMRENVRDEDLAARYGGEEFAVIMPATTLEAASAVAERIRQSVEAKRVMKRSTGEDLGTITMSLGVAHYRASESADELIRRADTCLYAAKHAGRNRVVTERELPADKAADLDSKPAKQGRGHLSA
jgi:diguanylate cyclase